MIHGIDTGFLVAVEVIEHPSHQAARDILKKLAAAGDEFGLSPQVFAEFIHVVTDAKRFTKPLSIDAARDNVQKWWTAAEVSRTFLNDAAIDQFFSWHRNHARTNFLFVLQNPAPLGQSKFNELAGELSQLRHSM